MTRQLVVIRLRTAFVADATAAERRDRMCKSL